MTSTSRVALQRLAISFENEIIVASNELAVYLIISAVRQFVSIKSMFGKTAYSSRKALRLRAPECHTQSGQAP